MKKYKKGRRKWMENRMKDEKEEIGRRNRI